MFLVVLICTEVIVKYRNKIRLLETEIKQILKQEEEEKQLRLTEMEINKATNLIEHHDKIMSRPARLWIKQQDRKRPADLGDGAMGMPLDKAAIVLNKRAKKISKKGWPRKAKNVGSVRWHWCVKIFWCSCQVLLI